MSSDDAVAQLGALSVTPAITYVPDDSVADGTVISQSPAPGRPLTGPVTLKVARTATTVYLSDEQPVEGEPSTDAQEIDNRQYLHSVALGDAEGAWQGTQVLEYHLGGRFTKLTGRLGLSSASHSDAVVNYRLTTIPSHGEKSGQLKVGQSTGVNLNVTGAVRIRLVVTPSPDEWSYSAPVFGDAKLLGFPNDLPTDTATSDE